jgi:hypothetical protein
VSQELQEFPISDVLAKAIAEAFRETETPVTEMLTPYDEHEWAIIKAFGRRHWSEVDVSSSEISNSPALYLLKPVWFHFYLPAYILALLQTKNSKVFAHNLLGVLTPPDKPASRHFVFEPRMQLLTTEQRAAVASFVEYTIKLYPERLSLYIRLPQILAYWHIEQE